MSEDTKRKLDNLQDPLAMISRFERAQKLLPLRGVKLSFVPSLEFLELCYQIAYNETLLAKVLV